MNLYFSASLHNNYRPSVQSPASASYNNFTTTHFQGQGKKGSEANNGGNVSNYLGSS